MVDRRLSPTKMMPLLVEEDYLLFLRDFPLDVRLPPQYQAWSAGFASEDYTHRAAGLNTRHILVRYGEITEFLRRIGLKPSYAALETFASYVGRRELEQETSRRH